MPALVDDAAIAFFAITLTALVYSALSTYATKTLGNRARVAQVQAEMNRINNMMSEAVKKNDEGKKKEAEKEQTRIPSLMKESMILQFKPLIVTLPIFFVASWLLKELFPYFTIKLAFSLPIVIQNLDRFPNWRDTFGVVGWFILALIFSGLLMQFITGKIEAMRKKK